MVNLQTTHPDVYDMFMKGFLVVNKTNNNFSMIGVDHNPEQKKGGTFVLDNEEDCDLTEALIAGPERARL